MRFGKAVIMGIGAFMLTTAPSLAQNPVSPMGPGMMPNYGPSSGPSANNGRYMGRRPPGGWRVGQRLQGRIRPMSNYAEYKLPPPPPGAGWVRSGNQCLMVSLMSGAILSIVPMNMQNMQGMQNTP